MNIKPHHKKLKADVLAISRMRSRYTGSHRPGLIRCNTQLATQHPTKADLDWAAGFLEGEGSFGHYGKTSLHNGSERVSAAQKQEECLYRLARLFGGRVGKYRKENIRGRIFCYWQINGTLARGLMMTLFPLLSKWRRKQITQALAMGT